MAKNSNISWTDHTWNGWIGCTKVSEGCANCYAAVQDRNRFSKTLGGATRFEPISHWGPGAPRHRTSEDNWKDPVKWNAAAAKRTAEMEELRQICDPRRESGDIWTVRRPRVFCSSLADWLDAEVPIEWLADLLALIHATPHLDWLLLTKRPQNFFTRREAAWKWSTCNGKDQPFCDWLRLWGMDGQPPANVWLGTTVENQKRADERIPLLLKIPARIRFLSCEPLLGPINLRQVPGPGSTALCANAFDGNALFIGDIGGTDFAWTPRNMINWVIAGGESGPGFRPMSLEWLADLAGACEAAGVAFFCKQDSASKPGLQGSIPAQLWERKQFPKT